MRFLCSRDLDLDPMTLIYESKNSVKKAYPHTKNEVYRTRISQVIIMTNRQTNAPKTIYYAATWVVKYGDILTSDKYCNSGRVSENILYCFTQLS